MRLAQHGARNEHAGVLDTSFGNALSVDQDFGEGVLEKFLRSGHEGRGASILHVRQANSRFELVERDVQVSPLSDVILKGMPVSADGKAVCVRLKPLVVFYSPRCSLR